MSDKRNDNDRLEANTQDGLAMATKSPANYLGNPDVVEKLVRDFFTVVFSERSKYHQSGGGDACADRISDVCKSYGSVFMGETSEYVPQPWNHQSRLGAYLRSLLEDVNSYASPGDAYFNFLAVQALNAAIALEEGAMTEDEVKAGMQEVVDDAVNVLLGRRDGVRG
jgi:hypothetical protein